MEQTKERSKSERIGELEYPFFETSLSFINSDNGIKLNPYEEFLQYSLHKYYNPNGALMTQDDIFAKTLLERKKIYEDNLSEFDGIFIGLEKTKTLTISYNGRIICGVYFDDSPEVITKYKYAVETKHSIRVIFSEFSDFDYLISNGNDSILNVSKKCYIFNDIEGGYRQIEMTLALIRGLINFDSFMKFHKLNGIKVGAIESYIKTKPSFDFGDAGKMTIYYGYDYAVVYTNVSGTEGLFRISYQNYVNDIDNIEKLILRNDEH